MARVTCRLMMERIGTASQRQILPRTFVHPPVFKISEFTATVA
jgi:hypothetical protein